MRHIAPHPTCKLALYIFRMLALHSVAGRILIKNANVDQDENLYNICSFHDCLVDRFKSNTKILKELNLEMDRELISELATRFVEDCGYHNKDTVDDVLVYDVCGYVVKARPFLTTNCIECKNSLVAEELLLPEDFCAANFTILKNKGGLIFVTIPMFLSFRTIEAVIAQHFANEKHVYITNTFRLCIKAISKSSIHPLFCEKHRKDSLPVLIREYVHIRFFFEQKRYNDFSFSKSNTQCKTKDKKKKSK